MGSTVTRQTRFQNAAVRSRTRERARQNTATAVPSVGRGRRPRAEPANQDDQPLSGRAAGWQRLRSSIVGDGPVPSEDSTDDQRSENLRRWMVNDRNRRRRWPWIPAAIAGVAGLSAHLLGAGLHTLSAEITPTVLAWPATLAPLIGTLVFTLRHRRAVTRWLPELAVFGFGSAALTYWLAVDGPSPFIALVALVATIISATRWWRAHPIGPQVKRLVPPELSPITPATPDPERDPYCVAWLENNASKDGKAPGSRLTNRRDDEFTTNYDIALKRGHQTVHDLQPNRAKLAGGLGEDTERVLFKAPPRGMGAHWARMTIIRKDPVADTRFYTGPQVEDGVIKNVARLVDGSGEMDVTMWDDNGTVGTMIVGSTGGGKSGAANIVTCSAMSTGLLNLLYADPKGNSSTALATRARVAVIGKQNVLRLPQLMTAMLAARAELAAELSSDLIFPSREIPGWMLLHDEYSLIASDPGAQKTWTETVNIVRAYGMWAVALNQSLGQPQWGTDHARSAFASQVVAFRINSKSGSDLVPGLTFDPNDLPVDDRGRPVPGMAVHAHHDTPTRWDFLPSTADAERMAAKELPAPPFTTVTAFDEFFAQPDLHPLDEAAITSVLGPAVNGRWQVGGPGATHQFRSGDAAQGPGAGPTDLAPKQPTRGRWGQRGTSTSGSHHAALTPVQAEVLEIVRGGTGVTGEIVEAATAARSSVMNALDVLIDRELIEKLSHGRYQHIPVTSTST